MLTRCSHFFIPQSMTVSRVFILGWKNRVTILFKIKFIPMDMTYHYLSLTDCLELEPEKT